MINITRTYTTKEARSFMLTISEENQFLTLINVFTVEPTHQQSLTDLLILATENSVQQIPGFVGASLHRSTDGTKVTMYAQWRSKEDYERMRADPSAFPYLEEALTFAQFAPGMYEVVKVFTSPS